MAVLGETGGLCALWWAQVKYTQYF